MNEEKMHLKFFYGYVDEWCRFVNENDIQENEISSTGTQLVNGNWCICATYWR